MHSVTKTGHLIVTFTPGDFKSPFGGALKIIEGIKKEIGHISKNQDGFEYFENSQEWEMLDTPQNRLILSNLRRQFLENPAQTTFL